MQSLAYSAVLARVYPKRFCSALYRAFFHTELRHLRRDLRNKNEVEPGLSDRELFERMQLSDVWSDANLADVYFYVPTWKSLIHGHRQLPNSTESWIPGCLATLAMHAEFHPLH